MRPEDSLGGARDGDDSARRKWRHVRASPPPVMWVTSPAASGRRARIGELCGEFFREWAFFLLRTMATDSWALAVDEQEAAVKSVSGFSSLRGSEAGAQRTLIRAQGATVWTGLWPSGPESLPREIT